MSGTTTSQHAASTFDVSFWLACEREADRLYRTMTGVDLREDAPRGS